MWIWLLAQQFNPTILQIWIIIVCIFYLTIKRKSWEHLVLRHFYLTILLIGSQGILYKKSLVFVNLVKKVERDCIKLYNRLLRLFYVMCVRVDLFLIIGYLQHCIEGSMNHSIWYLLLLYLYLVVLACKQFCLFSSTINHIMDYP